MDSDVVLPCGSMANLQNHRVLAAFESAEVFDFAKRILWPIFLKTMVLKMSIFETKNHSIAYLYFPVGHVLQGRLSRYSQLTLVSRTKLSMHYLWRDSRLFWRAKTDPFFGFYDPLFRIPSAGFFGHSNGKNFGMYPQLSEYHNQVQRESLDRHVFVW